MAPETSRLSGRASLGLQKTIKAEAFMRALVFLLLLSTVSSACAQNSVASDAPQVSTDSASRVAAEDQIAEAVFRYLFEHNASGIQKGAEKYCLSLPGEKMPGAAFLQRFEGNKPPVLAAG